jgi:endonuclease YncB( thermonuclease family)
LLRKIILFLIKGHVPFTRFKKSARIVRADFKSKRIQEKNNYNAYKKTALSEIAIKEKITYLPQAQVARVIDGDTVIISRSWRDIIIRLDSIDCPEDGQPWGDIAKYGLIKLIGGKKVHLEEHGIDKYGRTLATIYIWHQDKSEWLNVNERMVTLGHAWVMRRFYDHLPSDRQEKLNRLERWARSKKMGLWQTLNPIPPWKWRNG